MSEGIGTPDDGQRFDDLPLLSEKGGDKSEDESEDDITDFRGSTYQTTSLTSSEDPLKAPTMCSCHPSG
jgi:hypothetical protein